MGSRRAGQTRMTVSLCVIMLEMVNADGTLPFLMVVIIVAKVRLTALQHSWDCSNTSPKKSGVLPSEGA